MKFLDWKPIKWFIGLPMKTRIISAVVAGTVVVGSGVGVGVGVALNNDNHSSSDSSTSIEESIDSSIEDSSILDSSIDSSVEDSSSDNSSSVDSSVDSSSDSSSDSSMDSSDGSSSDSTEPAPHEHDFTLEVIENAYLKAEATCESKAVYYYACECGEQGETTFEYGVALGHDTIPHDAQAVTCLEKGWEAYETCSRCDYTTYTEIPALGHDKVQHDAQAATCTEKGWEEYEDCTRCEYTTYVEIPALDHEFTNYIPDNNATYTSDGTKTATCNRIGCNETHTITDEGTMLASGIVFKTLSVNGTDVYGKVSNETETFSFINEVQANGTAKYVVSLDIYGIQWIATKTIPLSIGDNTVYITETVDDEPINVYTVTVRRRPMYDVTFNPNGGTAVEMQVIEEDYFASEPTTTRTGYTFTGWDYDFTQSITQNTIVKASWTANTDTPYTVEYYLQNLENDEYTLHETVEKTGTTDTTATAEIKTFTHFTHNASETDSGNILPNGSTILKVYYTRDTYTVTFDGNGGTLISGTEVQTVKYGGSVTAPTFEKVGYAFDGFDKTDYTNVSENFTVTANWDIITYTITYDLDGGTLAENNDPTSYTVETETFTLSSIPRKKNYGFLGWYNGNQKIQTIEKGDVGTLNLVAKWEYALIISNNTVTGIASPAKANCYEIEVPNTVTTINMGAFSGCLVLEDLTLPFVGGSRKKATDTYQYPLGYIFGTSTYTGATATTQYYYGSSTSRTIYGIYYIPTSLKKVTVTGGNVLRGAFYNCRSLTSVGIGDSVASIGSNAFYGCNSLTNVYITDLSAWCNISFDSSSANPLCYAKNLYLNNELITELVIPDTVTKIKPSAFYNCDSLTSVNIPDSVTSIGNSAFSGCDSLTSIEIPDSVTSIGNDAFYSCDKLRSVVIGDSVTSIGNDAFYSCDKLRSVVIGDSVTSIGSNAFYYCSNLTSIEIPDSVASIGDYAFAYCDSLTSVEIGDNVTSIGDYAFYDCNSLTNVYITDLSAWCNISFDSSSANPLCYAKNLYLNNELITELVIPDTVTKIKPSAFYNCDSLTSVNIPDSVTSIGNSAFSGCSSLTSIEIPDSVASIGNDAFYGCSNLTSIEIPDSVASIGEYAFSSCDGLTNVYITDLEAWCNISLASTSANPLYYAENLYLNNELVTELVIPDTVTEIKPSAFNGCSSLTSVVIPDSVTSIGDYAFSSCDSLTSVVIPDSVTSISSAFYNCDSLTSVVIPDSVTTIGDHAFRDCDGLTSVVIPDSVTSIGDWAFDGCYRLVEVVNKSPSITVTKGSTANGYVGYYALAVYNSGDTCNTKISNDNGYIVYTDGAEKILVGYNDCETDLILPSYITQINRYALYNCSNLTSVEIPDSVASIGEYAFYNCSSLTSVVIPDSVTSISSAFYNCDSLTSVVIPDSVTTIGDHAFRDCDGLTSVVIPDSVTSIGDWAFSGCSSLTSVVIPDSVTSIGSCAFQVCSSLTSVVIPDSVTSVGYFAFFGNKQLIIFCESNSRPSGWSDYWNCYTYSSGSFDANGPVNIHAARWLSVVWGYKE